MGQRSTAKVRVRGRFGDKFGDKFNALGYGEPQSQTLDRFACDGQVWRRQVSALKGISLTRWGSAGFGHGCRVRLDLWSERHVSDEILLEGNAEGDRLRLAGAGAWTATRARRLEALINAAAEPRRPPIKRVDIDMSRVERLDTYGALLLERMEHEFAARGAATNLLGLKEDHRTLLEKLHALKPEVAPAA